MDAVSRKSRNGGSLDTAQIGVDKRKGRVSGLTHVNERLSGQIRDRLGVLNIYSFASALEVVDLRKTFRL